MRLKTATFTVHADARQSARWKQASQGEGFPSVGAWLAGAADSYLRVRARAGLPIPLAWRKGLFRVELDGGETTVRGYVSLPFGVLYGTPAGVPLYLGAHRYTLVYIPSKQALATLRTYAECRSLAAELARQWFRSDGTATAPVPQFPS